jgi:hypothetical protein
MIAPNATHVIDAAETKDVDAITDVTTTNAAIMTDATIMKNAVITKDAVKKHVMYVEVEEETPSKEIEDMFLPKMKTVIVATIDVEITDQTDVTDVTTINVMMIAMVILVKTLAMIVEL